MKKNLLSLVLALAVCLGLAVPALASETVEGSDAIKIEGDWVRVEQEYSIYTESWTAGYTGGGDFSSYYSMKSGTPITVSNVGTDSSAIVYVYYNKYTFAAEPKTVYKHLGQDEYGMDVAVPYVIQNVYYGSDYTYALTNRTDLPYAEPSINSLNWAGMDYIDTDNVTTLHAGESVTFALPNTSGEDIFYRLYAEIYYPDRDGGVEYSYFSRWYNIKVEDTSATSTAPAASANLAATSAFTDVPASEYYAEPVSWAIEKGITNGTSANKFSPEETCSNAQILTFLWRACGEPEPAIGNPYSNVAESDYYYKAARWAYEKDMVSGTTFDADKPCTRAMTVTYIWQSAGSPAAASAVSFTDVPASASYAAAVAWAVNQGITNGDGANTFSPDKTCTRGQIVTFLYRAFA